MYSKLSDGYSNSKNSPANLTIGGTINSSGAIYSNLKGIEVPYTKDNFQIICQLIKLGILQDLLVGDGDHKSYTSKGDNGKGNFGVCHVNFNQMFLGSLAPHLSKDNNVILPQRGTNVGGNELAGPTSLSKKRETKKNLLTLVSKPGRKIFISYKDLKDLNSGFKLYILRTSQGIITSQTALKNKIGGEVLFKISFAS
jgi:ribosomal protein S8